jgi:hypothetical protein
VTDECCVSAVSKAILPLIVVVFALVPGCGPTTIWSTETRSPDGLWLASAHTLENSGFGTGGYVTNVDLKRTNVSQPPQPILSFWHDPSLASPQSGSTINLTMKWTSPTRLEVTYDGHASLGLQVVRYANVEISVRDLLSEANTSHEKP